MEKFVSMGSVNNRHYVFVTENYLQIRHGPLPSREEARKLAAAESNRLGIGPAYVGIGFHAR